MPGIGCGAAQQQDTPFAAACKPRHPAQFGSSVCLGAYAGRKTTRRWRGGFLSDDQIFVTILMPGPMVDAVTQDLIYWPFEAAGLALMIAPMSAL